MMPLTDSNPDTAARTLWMGDLAYWMDESFVFSLFAHTGELLHVKIIRSKVSGASEGYGFLEFQTREAAETILHTFNGQPIPSTDQIFRLNWAAFGVGKTSEADYSVFVGDLAPDVTDFILQEFFRQFFPSVRSAKVITDPVTGRSKGYGFVRFASEPERDRALHEMNGQFISTRPIRVSLATAKKSQPGLPLPTSAPSTPAQPSDMDPNNTTLFIGGLSASVQEEQLRSIFGHFGDIIYTKIPPGKGCGFVQFVERKHAEKAMAHLNGTVIGNSAVRISWGKSTGKSGAGVMPAPATASGSAPAPAAGYGSGYSGAYPSYGYDGASYSAGYGAYGDPYTMYQQYPQQAYPGYGVPPPPTSSGSTGMVATGAHGVVGQGTLVSVYDPLAPVDVDKLNAAFVHRNQPMLTGSFLRVAAECTS